MIVKQQGRDEDCSPTIFKRVFYFEVNQTPKQQFFRNRAKTTMAKIRQIICGRIVFTIQDSTDEFPVLSRCNLQKVDQKHKCRK